MGLGKKAKQDLGHLLYFDPLYILTFYHFSRLLHYSLLVAFSQLNFSHNNIEDDKSLYFK